MEASQTGRRWKIVLGQELMFISVPDLSSPQEIEHERYRRREDDYYDAAHFVQVRTQRGK